MERQEVSVLLSDGPEHLKEVKITFDPDRPPMMLTVPYVKAGPGVKYYQDDEPMPTKEEFAKAFVERLGTCIYRYTAKLSHTPLVYLYRKERET